MTYPTHDVGYGGHAMRWSGTIINPQIVIPRLLQLLFDKRISNLRISGYDTTNTPKFTTCEVELDSTDKTDYNDILLALMSDHLLGPDDLPKRAQPPESFAEAKEKFAATFERSYVIDLLRRNRGNVHHAAKEADVDIKTFRQLMLTCDVREDDYTSY